MREKLFLQAMELCLSASIVTGVVLLLRLLLKKAPRWISCALWALVALRLVIPALPESKISVIPERVSGAEVVEYLQARPAEPVDTIWEGDIYYEEIRAVYRDLPVRQAANGQKYVEVSSEKQVPPKTLGDTVVPLLSLIWTAGVGIMLLYMLGSYAKLRRRLRTAGRREEGVWESEAVTSPFILGLVRPRIYLPTSLNEQEAAFVLAHERTHIRRGDHIWKPLGFVLLAVYWFNPIFWLAWVLLCRDIEAACDEKVIRDEDAAYRKAYSETLLALNVRERRICACPLAFAENGVKERVRSVLNYKKPAFWLIVAALVISVAAAGCALTDPAKKSTEPAPESSTQETEENTETEEDPAETQEITDGGTGKYAAMKIEASFPLDVNGMTIYPEDYAGCYPDGRKIVLCLKDPDEEGIKQYMDLIPGLESTVTIKAVSRSYNELEQMLRETAEELRADKIQVDEYSVDVKNNGMQFGVTDIFVETVRARLQEKYPDIPVTVDAVGPICIDLPEQSSPLIDPDAVSGIYTFSEGVIRDYIGEWGDERYFVLQIPKPAYSDNESMYRYAVGHARRDEKSGAVLILADLECNYYLNGSKLIDGTIYVATEKGIFAVTPEGTVTKLTGEKEVFSTYPSAGDLFLYSYMLRREEGFAICLEAYYPRCGQTIRYLTLENSMLPENEGNNRYISAAGALDVEDGFYYVLLQGTSKEIWYQPCSVRDAEEGVVREARPMEGTKMPIQQIFGNEHFYALISAIDSMRLHLTFLDEPATARELQIAGPWSVSPIGATPGQNGKWCFTAAKMRFEVDAETRECTVRELGTEYEEAGWSLLSLSGDSREIILQSADARSMLFVGNDRD